MQIHIAISSAINSNRYQDLCMRNHTKTSMENNDTLGKAKIDGAQRSAYQTLLRTKTVDGQSEPDELLSHTKPLNLSISSHGLNATLHNSSIRPTMSPFHQCSTAELGTKSVNLPSAGIGNGPHQITSIDGFFNRKRGRPPKNRFVEVYKSTQHSPQAIFTSFKLEKHCGTCCVAALDQTTFSEIETLVNTKEPSELVAGQDGSDDDEHDTVKAASDTMQLWLENTKVNNTPNMASENVANGPPCGSSDFFSLMSGNKRRAPNKKATDSPNMLMAENPFDRNQSDHCSVSPKPISVVRATGTFYPERNSFINNTVVSSSSLAKEKSPSQSQSAIRPKRRCMSQQISKFLDTDSTYDDDSSKGINRLIESNALSTYPSMLTGIEDKQDIPEDLSLSGERGRELQQNEASIGNVNYSEINGGTELDLTYMEKLMHMHQLQQQQIQHSFPTASLRQTMDNPFLAHPHLNSTLPANSPADTITLFKTLMSLVAAKDILTAPSVDATTNLVRSTPKKVKDDRIPLGYRKFRFNEDCGFSKCGYRNHQSHFHCNRNSCQYSFCDKTRFVQHTARHERLAMLMGDDFQQYRANMPCGHADCIYSDTGDAEPAQASVGKKSSHFHCLRCDFVCTDTNKVIAHRRFHSKMDYIRLAGFRRVANTENCTSDEAPLNFGINVFPGDSCQYSRKHTHYHCLTCGFSVLSRTQLANHKHRTKASVPN